MNKAHFPEVLTDRVSRIEEALALAAAEFKCPAKLKEAMTYSLLGGGKRIRPLLVLAAGELAGLEEAKLLPMAEALEMIHTYSLIHDDLPAMDDDDLRRGRPTSHKVFGEAMAILAGDALLNEAMLLLMKTYGGSVQGARAIAKIAEASGKDGMIGGQVIDLESENQAISLDTLELMHRGKTGALIEASLAAPFYLAGKTDQEIVRMEQIGKDLGIMFQIQDDILDVESDAKTMGKTTGKDARDHKSTYVSLVGLEESRQRVEEIYRRILTAISESGEAEGLLYRLTEAIYRRDH